MNPNRISVEIRAESHNPTILNPDFLQRYEIVSSSWIVSEPPICTPSFAMVKFAQGIRFFAQSESIEIIQSIDEMNSETGIVAPAIAGRYVKQLPHVKYTGVDICFSALLPMDAKNSRRFVRERFIKDGAWNSLERGHPEARIRFVYWDSDEDSNDDAVFVTIHSIKDEDIVGVSFEFNFHRHFDGEETDSERLQDISNVLNSWNKDLDRATAIWGELSR